MHRSQQSVARLVALATITLAACQDATNPPTAPVVPQAPQAARSPQAQARLEAIFQDASPEVMALPGTVFADNDEVVGKVVFGVENANAANGVRQALRRRGVDEADYAIELTAPIVTMQGTQTLRSQFGSKVGGIQLHFTRYLCTLGFNAMDGTESSFITNSHCTATQGGVENTVYYQPTSSTGAVIATEVEDPPYVKGGGCPKGKKCRYSDASRARYATGVTSILGAIAKPTGIVNTGSLAFSGSYFTLSGSPSTELADVGTVAQKVGRTTGWTSGKVTRSCANTSVSGSTVYLFCQTFVSDPGGATVVGGGDSGSAVFGAGSGNVQLLGILWGGSSDNKSFVFSPFAQIQQEIGTLRVN
jgi:hypothetical protein